MLGLRIARAYPDRIAHLALTAPIGLEDYRLNVPPMPNEKILENEDKLTADGYRKQLETNRRQNCRPNRSRRSSRASTSRAAPNSALPARLRQSAQMIYREPVAHEIPLIT